VFLTFEFNKAEFISFAYYPFFDVWWAAPVNLISGYVFFVTFMLSFSLGTSVYFLQAKFIVFSLFFKEIRCYDQNSVR